MSDKPASPARGRKKTALPAQQPPQEEVVVRQMFPHDKRLIDKIPSVHLGPAASQMEKRGIRTDKGEVNRTGKIRALQESAALFSFMQTNGIKTMQQFHDKISDMNSSYYDLRGKIVQAERRIAALTERGEMWAQYNKYKPIRKQLAKVKPEKRELFEQRHSRELILYDAAARYLKELKAVERLRKAADQLARQGQDKSHDRGAGTVTQNRGVAFHDTPLHTEKPPYRFPHTAAALSFIEQVAVRSGAGQRQHQHIVLNAVDEQPVRLNVAFPMPHPIAGKFVVFVFFWQFFAS